MDARADPRLSSSVAPDRLYAAWLQPATTGMRRGELLGLRWDDVDLRLARRRHHRPAVGSLDGESDQPSAGQVRQFVMDVGLELARLERRTARY